MEYASGDPADDLVSLLDETDLELPVPSSKVWRVLVVDDDPGVHSTTEFSLRGVQILGRPLELLHAHSAKEARELLTREDDVAVVLLDVVMEREDAGLSLVKVIRDELGLSEPRIILRTGQPGYAPELDVIRLYDINDYKTKSELTQTKLYTALTSAIRSYKQIRALASSRRGLEMIVRASTELMAVQGLHRFSAGVVTQICALLELPPDGLVCVQSTNETQAPRIVAAAGRYRGLINSTLDNIDQDVVRSALTRCLSTQRSFFDQGTALYIKGSSGKALAAYIDTEHVLSDIDHQLLEVFCANVAVGLDNVQLFARLNESVFVDSLTRLPNRNRLIALLDERCQNAAASTTLALVDIDDFADINDALGHELGDSLLQAVADRLTRALKAPVVVARVSGDVFGVLGPDGHVTPALLAAQFLLPFECQQGNQKDSQQESLQITATIGFVRLADSSGKGTEVLKDANIALKRSKTRQRGGHGYYTQDMGADIRERVKLLRGLRSAFESERLFVMYQPQLQLMGNRVLGAEALIRWKTEDGKFVPPDRFIPVAEYSGLIVAIGEWVLRTACRELNRLIDLGYPDFRMAVNVSVAQLRHPDFIAMLQGALADTGVNPAQVELEITESMAMEDVNFIVQIVDQIKQTGVTIAIDDFGTGFSSLSQLRHLRVDRLKIDRAFVNEIVAIDKGCDIARMVVELARSLHLEVLAEGIETEQQAAVLRELGCHEGQGYLFARPMEPAQLVSWLAEHRG